MGRLQTDKKMHVISHTANALGKSAQTADRSAEIFVQTRFPRVTNCRLAVFCAENKMEMQAEVGGWHAAIINRADRRRATTPSGSLCHKCHPIPVAPPVASLRSAT